MTGYPVEAFNTRLMDNGAVLALETGRERERQAIAAAIEANLQVGRQLPQHLLIHGPDGIGKTFMTRIARIEAEARRIAVVVLPDEHPSLIRAPHRFLASIAARLADLRQSADHAWTATMFAWPEGTTSEAKWSTALLGLNRELDQSFGPDAGHVLVIVENFDRLLVSAFAAAADRQRLLGWMASPDNRVMLVATAAGSLDGDLDRSSLKGFIPIRLDPWRADDCVAYLNRLRATRGQPPLPSAGEATVRTLAPFIEGNPRLVRLLSNAMAEAAPESGAAPSMAAIMAALCDPLAGFHQRRVEDPPPLAQGLLDALIRGGEPCSATELARRVGADGQRIIARAMQDLQRTGMIAGRAAPDGKETLFRVVDRAFVHAYRLRNGSPVDGQHLPTILEWLRASHSLAGREQHAAGVPAPAMPDPYVLLTPENGPNPRRDAYRGGFIIRLMQWLGSPDRGETDAIRNGLATAPAALAAELEALPPATLLRDRVIVTTACAQAYVRQGRLEEALVRLTTLSQALSDPTVAATFLKCELSLLLLCELNQDRLAAEMLARVEQSAKPHLMPTAQLALMGVLAFNAHVSGDPERTIIVAREAAALAASLGDRKAHVGTMILVAASHGALGFHDGAITVATQARDLAILSDDRRARTLATVILFYSQLQAGQPDEALEHAAELVADDAALAAGIRGEVLDVALRTAIAAPCRGVVALGAGMIAARDRIYSFFAAATRAGAWDDLDAYLDRQRPWLEQTIGLEAAAGASDIGKAIAWIGRDEGHDAACDAARNICQRLLPLLPGSRDAALASLLTGLAQTCKDPALLRDVAAMLLAEWPPLFRDHARLLTSVADVDDSGPRRDGVVARLDPDIALLVRQLRNLPDNPSPSRAKRRKSEDTGPEDLSQRVPHSPSESARM